MLSRRSRWLASLLFSLAALLAANSILGPFLTGTIEYRFSESLIYQGIGLDAVALAGAAPIAVAAALLVLRRHPAGPVVAFIPATFAAYMAPQYVVGPEYLTLSGNNEQFILLHLALLVLGVATILVAWRAVDRGWLPPASRRSDRRRSWVLWGVVAFIGGARWLPAIAELVAGDPAIPDYLENPTSFLLIGLLDLGLVVPAAVAAAIALRKGVEWARTAAYAVIGWFALVPAAVAAMAVTMQVNGDPNASTGMTVVFVVAAVVFTAGAAVLYAPLFRTGRARPFEQPDYAAEVEVPERVSW